jgi:hypothetical protein
VIEFWRRATFTNQLRLTAVNRDDIDARLVTKQRRAHQIAAGVTEDDLAAVG